MSALAHSQARRASLAAVAAALLLGGTALGQGRAARSCAAEIGDAGAQALVRQCREVSLASRSPCSPTSSCALIRDEVRRSCTLLSADAPAFCRTYVDDDEIEDDEEEG